MKIRRFKLSDTEQVIEILKLNRQYVPQVEGPENMKRVSRCKAAVYLVATKHGKVVGVVRGVYDGSRALIHQLSVHPHHQKQGVGTALTHAIATQFKTMGAPTLSVTANTQNQPFFQRLGFTQLPQITFMLANDIDQVATQKTPTA